MPSRYAAALRHAVHYASIAKFTHELRHQKSEQQYYIGLARFDADRIQIDSGWDWAGQQESTEADHLLLEYTNANASLRSLRYSSDFTQRPRLDAALAAAQRLGNKGAEILVLEALASLTARIGDATLSAEYDSRALRLTEQLDDWRWEGPIRAERLLDTADSSHVVQAIELAKQAQTIAHEVGDGRGEGAALVSIADAYLDMGDDEQAIDYYNQALSIARAYGDPAWSGRIIEKLAYVHISHTRHQHAIELYEQALEIVTVIGDRHGEASILGNLGLTYSEMGNYQRALELYQKSISISQALNDLVGESVTWSNIGNVHVSLGNATQAIVGYTQALALARTIDDRRSEAIASWNLGNMLEKQGDLEGAASLMQIYIDFAVPMGLADAGSDSHRLEQLRKRIANIER